MPIPPPVLDDRGYEQLRQELLRRIEVFTPEWRDRSPSDPGVTLLELVAFLGETLLYRFNQIPDATRLWMLRLLDVRLRPARPARGLVVLTTPTPAAGAVERGAVARAGAVEFAVGQDVTVLPVGVAAVVKAPTPEPTDPDLRAASTAALLARGLADDESPAWYRPSTLDPDPLAPGALPLPVPDAVDRTLWIAVTVDAPPATPDQDPMRPGGPLDGARLTLGFVLDADAGPMQAVDPCPGAAANTGPAPVARLEWQVSTVTETPDGEPRYRPLTVVDRTDGLRHDGVAEVVLPENLPGIGLPEPDDPDAAGAGAYPPELESGATVLFWLRVFPAAGAPDIPPLRLVAVNAAEVEQAVEAGPEYLGTGTGMPDQRAALVHRPVVVGDGGDGGPVIEVEESGRWTPWTPVDTFAASTGTDRHYVLDAEAGVVTFGDTTRGRGPQPGERIRALRYRHGGGERGNVGAGTITQVPAAPESGPVEVTNPLGLRGGTAGETVDEALDRAPGEFRRHDRAVTSSDFAELARQTPGGEVGRAECLPRFDPRTVAQDAAGVVTVVVWPRRDPAHPEAPRPDRTLLRRVCAYLDPRRLVTTELYVVQPAYRRVAVAVGLSVAPGYSGDAVRRWVELVIRQYLAPLPPFGPSGAGWPLGRRVHGPELEAAALQVDGVEFLTGLDVAEVTDAGVVPGTVVLNPWEAVELAEIAVATGDPPPVGAGPAGPPPGGVPVPVPVPRKEC